MACNVCHVNFTWDDEAFVWFATSPEAPGFALEDDSFGLLCEKIRIGLPDFLSEIYDNAKKIPIVLNMPSEERAAIYG